MAIDWGRMAKGVATGYLSAKIANTEANDKLNADIHKAAGVNFYTNTLPDHQKKERVREREFKQISNFFESDDAANYFGDQGFITGDGKSLDIILATLKAKKLNPNTFKKDFKWEGSTYAERKENRFLDIQDAERIATGLSTGSSKIGPMTVKNQLEGLGTGTGTKVATDTGTEPVGGMLPGGEKELSATPDITKSLGLSDMFGATVDERGVESKYAHVERAIEAQHGYAQTHEIGADGQVTFTWGPKRKIAAAHIQFATMLLDKNPNLDQNTAASAAKRYLVFYTEKPFADLNSINELKNTPYEQGDETNRAIYKGAGKIDINSTQYKGMPIKNYILDKIDNLPKTRDGNINEAIFQKFVENVPENLMDGDITFRASLLAQRQTQELVNNYFTLK
jgi:hypothetical protein